MDVINSFAVKHLALMCDDIGSQLGVVVVHPTRVEEDVVLLKLAISAHTSLMSLGERSTVMHFIMGNGALVWRLYYMAKACQGTSCLLHGEFSTNCCLV
jgi:hypothetical protein